MVRRLLLGLVLVAFLFAAGDVADSPVPGKGVFADSWECVEYNTDYSPGCKVSSETCGTSCFYANCGKCADGCHEHCRTECDEDCDDEGNCSETCWEVCWDERHGVSSCVDWTWHLYGEEPGSKMTTTLPFNNCDGTVTVLVPEPGEGYYDDKEFSESTPRLGPALGLVGDPPMRNTCTDEETGILYNPTPQPSIQPDTSGGGTLFLDEIHAGVTPDPTVIGSPGPVSGLEAAFFSGGMDVRRRVSISDLDTEMDSRRALAEVGDMSAPSGLLVIPGEPGSPSLLSAVKVVGDDSRVTLSVGGGDGGRSSTVLGCTTATFPTSTGCPSGASPRPGLSGSTGPASIRSRSGGRAGGPTLSTRLWASLVRPCLLTCSSPPGFPPLTRCRRWNTARVLPPLPLRRLPRCPESPAMSA